MYTEVNFPSKAALKRAIAAGEQIGVFQPNADITGARVPTDGTVTLEGPHSPRPHTWYGQGVLENGVLVSVK